ncbi:MAG TPA: anti-sigma factor [Chitinophagaceae bacterium]
MDIKAYIASGIVETYVLGMASPAEKAEFEKLAEIYPELVSARNEFELGLEEKAFANAIPPPFEVKERVLDLISQEAAVEAVKRIMYEESNPPPVRKISSMRWAVTTSIVLLVGSLTFIYWLYTKNQQLKADIAQSKETLEQLDQQKRSFEEATLPENSSAKQVKVITPETVPATINVFWDSTNTHVYLVIRDLIKLAENEKYQLWSITKGKYQSLGLFDAPDNDKLVLKLNNSQQAEAFAISIAKKLQVEPSKADTTH